MPKVLVSRLTGQVVSDRFHLSGNGVYQDLTHQAPQQKLAHRGRAVRAPSSFVQALIDGDLASANKLLLAGADVNATYGESNWTALHFAVENQVAESVGWLLERGADINAKDTFGQTPLHLAIDSEADSSRHQFDVTGLASLSGEITKLLLKSGADANARTIRGKTPLDFARETGHSVAVEELRRYGGH